MIFVVQQPPWTIYKQNRRGCFPVMCTEEHLTFMHHIVFRVSQNGLFQQLLLFYSKLSIWLHNQRFPKSIDFISFFFFKEIIYLFLERGEWRERETSMLLLKRPPTGDLAHNPGMCPNWESNQQPFGLQVGTQSTKPHQPGPDIPL